MNEIGETLKETRESAGVSLKEASKDLNIKEEMLENIEDGRTGAFKDIFELKEYISSYAKYLGLDPVKLIDEFNEYMFEYTSKIPIKEIEKTILKNKDDKKEEVISPYTREKRKHKNSFYILIYVLILILVIVTIFWSVKIITVDKSVTTTISYNSQK